MLEIQIQKESLAEMQLANAGDVLRRIKLLDANDDEEEKKHRIEKSVKEANLALYCILDALEKLDRKPTEIKTKVK